MWSCSKLKRKRISAKCSILAEDKCDDNDPLVILFHCRRDPDQRRDKNWHMKTGRHKVCGDIGLNDDNKLPRLHSYNVRVAGLVKLVVQFVFSP